MLKIAAYSEIWEQDRMLYLEEVDYNYRISSGGSTANVNQRGDI